MKTKTMIMINAAVALLLIPTGLFFFSTKTLAPEEDKKNLDISHVYESHFSSTRLSSRGNADPQPEEIDSDILNDEARFGDMYASSRLQLGYHILVLEKDDKKIEIDRSKDEIGGHAFGNLHFSPSGRYLLYKGHGWEWTIGFIYDTEEGKKIFELADPGTMTLTRNEKYLYSCTADHFAGINRGTIYSVPNMTEIFSLMNNIRNKKVFFSEITCTYNEGKNQITFNAKDDIRSDNITQSLIYDLNTGNVVE